MGPCCQTTNQQTKIAKQIAQQNQQRRESQANQQFQMNPNGQMNPNQQYMQPMMHGGVPAPLPSNRGQQSYRMPNANSRLSVGADAQNIILDQIPFQELQIKDITQQSDLESYFVRSIALNRKDIVEQILNLNLVQGRNTIASVLHINQVPQQKTPFIDNVTHLSLMKCGVQPPCRMRIANKVKDVSVWNPILLMVALNQQKCLEQLLMTRVSEHLHLSTCLMKQFTLKRQTELCYTMEKTIKTECYALKLCIKNQNERMLKFLLNGKPLEFASSGVSTPMNQLSQIWNLGHIMQCLRYIINFRWENGVVYLFANQRVKQLFGSVNDVNSFIELLFQMLDIITGMTVDEERHRFLGTLMRSLGEHPYTFLKVCLSMFIQGKFKKDLDKLVTDSLDRLSLPFFLREVEQIFNLYDPEGVFVDNYDLIEKKILEMDEKDENIKSMYDKLMLDAKQFQIMTSEEQTEDFLEQLKDLDAFAFKTGVGSGRETYSNQDNVFQLILKSGNEQIIEYFYSRDSDCNVKAMLVRNDLQMYIRGTDAFKEANRFEITPTIPQIDIQFFKNLFSQKDFAKFQFTFQFVIDQLRLRHVLGVLKLIAHDDENEDGIDRQIELIDYILSNKKFISLFRGSLEMQKFNFIEQFMGLFEDQEAFNQSFLEASEKKKLKALLKKHEHISEYVTKINNDQKGFEYMQATQDYLYTQATARREKTQFVPRYVISENMKAYFPEKDPSDKVEDMFKPMPHRGTVQSIGSVGENVKRVQTPQLNNPYADNMKSPERDSLLESSNRRESSAAGKAINMGALVNQGVKQEISPFTNQSQPKHRESHKNSLQQFPNRFLKKEDNADLIVGEMLSDDQDEDDHKKELLGKLNQDKVVAGNRQERMNSRIDSKFLNDQGIKSPAKESINDQESNVFLDEEDIQCQFDELVKYKITGEISIAFMEIIKELKNENKEISDDFNDVMACYKLNPFEAIQVMTGDSQDAEKDFENDQNDWLRGKTLWNMLLISIYFSQTEMVENLLLGNEYFEQINPMAIQKPPDSNQCYHIMESDLISPIDNVFAFKLAILNRSQKILLALIETFTQSLTCKDICAISNFIIMDFKNPEEPEGAWYEGMRILLRTNTVKLMFSHLRPQEKELLIEENLITPLVQVARIFLANKDKKKKQLYEKFIKMVFTELSNSPYVHFCALKYPGFFDTHGLLQKSLKKIGDEDIIIFMTAKSTNLDDLLHYSGQNPTNMMIQQITNKATQKRDRNELILPHSPLPLLQFILNADLRGFITYFNSGTEQPELFKYFGYQMTRAQQKHTLTYFPQDEIIQQLLYDVSAYKKDYENQSGNSDEEHTKLIENLRQQVILTKNWNPLIFAIYYGQIEIVSYMLQNQNTQHLYYLLSDPFTVNVKENDDNNSNDAAEGPNQLETSQFYKERTELFPMILCLITGDHKMFEQLWNQQFLWNKGVYLIILGNFVFETESPTLIRAFLLSEKTKKIFNQISLAEKQKFIDFVIKSLEHQIIEDSQIDIEQDDQVDEEQEKIRNELESILNKEMLARPPYSLVNLTENLFPLNIHSTKENLIQILDQYRSSPESYGLLELTLKNLEGIMDEDEEDYTVAYRDKWVLINQNQIWAKKLRCLVDEIMDENPELDKEFPILEKIQNDLFGETVHL